MSNDYPKWRYHPKHGGRIFNSPEETKWHWATLWRDWPYPEKPARKPIRWALWITLINVLAAVATIATFLKELL